MNISRFKALLGATALTIVAASAAQAGGFSRGTADTDILYEEGNFNLRTGVTVVNPTRKFTANSQAALVGVDYADTYAVPSAAVKFKILEDMSCAGTFTQSFGGDATWPVPSGPIGKLNEDFAVNEFGATCGYKVDLGKGRLWLLGGVFMETVKYDLVALAGALDGTLRDTNVGWRAGIGYDIPEIALRAQLMYRSGFSVDANGNALLFGGNQIATGTADLPQSVEVKLQSGIAPGWLAYGSVKWTDWSVTKELILRLPNAGLQSKNDYFWRDGWTVTGGVGRAFTDRISGTAFVSWDRGVGTGWDLTAETYTLGVGASMKDKWGELRLGAAAIHMGEVSETQPGSLMRTVGADWGFAFSAGYGVKW
ncbi:outer membrane protein transport protein [Aminobacter sp. HY435]|uniref:outer membrane protein transport protein n=1 Tax=Aminobacter sp. HY435 TaxID=2970917 RepID=UPI0022B94412|nr:outer membrane protein transport protein [Aminobacter sp. HY435]